MIVYCQFVLGPNATLYVNASDVGRGSVALCPDALRAAQVPHKVWLEQPENLPTAIALKPSPRSAVAPLLKKYQLFK